MAEQKQVSPQPAGKQNTAAADAAPAAQAELVKKGKKLKEDLDKLLDEIDDILEENAAEHVAAYVQRGGE